MAIEFKLRERKKEESKTTNPIKAPISRDKVELEKKIIDIMQNGGDADRYLELAKSYKKLKKYDKAINNLNKAKSISSFNSEIYYELGINYLFKDEMDIARKNFIRTIKLDDENLRAQLQLAVSHELMGEDFMAIDIYKTIIEKKPDYMMAYNHLASLYMEFEMFEDAAKLFYRALEIQPDYYRANLGLGLCFDKMKKYSLAVRFYKKYIARKPKNETSHALASRIYDIYTKLTSKEKNGLRLV